MPVRKQTSAIDGFGPACMPELRAVGILTTADIQRMGWQEAFERWTERFPARINLNCATALFAAEQGISWTRVTPADKVMCRAAVDRMRAYRSD